MSHDILSAFSLATLRKAALAAVLLGGTALATLPAHATVLASGEGDAYRVSDSNDAGEGNSFRIGAGEGETFRTSDANDAGEGDTFRIGDSNDAGEGDTFRIG